MENGLASLVAQPVCLGAIVGGKVADWREDCDLPRDEPSDDDGVQRRFSADRLVIATLFPTRVLAAVRGSSLQHPYLSYVTPCTCNFFRRLQG